MKYYQVAAAILVHDHHILCMQRPQGKYKYMDYKYEFPGGKVETGESIEDALMRELREELNIDVPINASHHYMTLDYAYPDFSITLHSFLVPVASRTFDMCEHIDYRWCLPKDLRSLDWALADDPIIHRLMNDASLVSTGT